MRELYSPAETWITSCWRSCSGWAKLRLRKTVSHRHYLRDGRLVKRLTAFLFWSTLSLCLNAQITLGPTVDTFGVLGGSTVTNSGPTVVIGNLGVSPGTAITGFTGIAPGGPGLVSGSIHSADPFALQAQNELTAAYNAAAGAASTATKAGDLGGQTLFAGVYTSSSSLGITGTLILDGQGNPNAQFIFQIGSTLTTATSSSVSLINGAQASKVFWQVGSSATLGTTSTFSGNILALASISMGTGAVLQGRALARTGAVTMLSNVVTSPPGSAGPPPPLVTPAPSSLILVTTALLGLGIYHIVRKRRLKPVRTS